MTSAAPHRILVYDHDLSSDHVASVVEERHPVEIAVAHDLNAAVDELEKGDLALVVVDDERPRRVGHDLLEWMEGHHVDVPVVIGSGGGDRPELLGEFPDLVLIFERKPLSVELLEDLVELYTE
jgi:DNA-binding NtrC family response regulator